MTRSTILTLLFALPLSAQESQPSPFEMIPGMGGITPGKGPVVKVIGGDSNGPDMKALREGFEAQAAEMRKRMQEKYDSNGDGQLDEEEKKAMRGIFSFPRRGEGKEPTPEANPGAGSLDALMPKLMEKFDANKDGELEQEEIAAMEAAARARYGSKMDLLAPMAQQLRQKHDANQDGRLNADELAALQADVEANYGPMIAMAGLGELTDTPADKPADKNIPDVTDLTDMEAATQAEDESGKKTRRSKNRGKKGKRKSSKKGKAGKS